MQKVIMIVNIRYIGEKSERCKIETFVPRKPKARERPRELGKIKLRVDGDLRPGLRA